MARKESPWKKEYRKYLLTPEWKALRARVIERDGGKCVRCGSEKELLAHHLFYRDFIDDAQPEDLQTLCKLCHLPNHGITPNEYQHNHDRVNKILIWRTCDADRVPPEEWRKLYRLIKFPCELEWFAALLFPYISHICNNPRVGWRVQSNLNKRAEKWRLETGLA